jgi:PAS domain S-box-containing protein
LVQNLLTEAKVLGKTSASALAFQDPDFASKLLAGLDAEPRIFAACIYADDGSIFARYVRGSDGYEFPTNHLAPEHQFHDKHLDIFSPISFEKSRIGTLYIRSNIRELSSRIKRYILIALCVMVFSLLVALSISEVFQRIITRPLSELEKTAKLISEEKDFSVRAVKYNEDELGVLTDSFNEMLRQIELKDLELYEHSESLEEMVSKQKKTAEILRESEEKYRGLFNEAFDMIHILDKKGMIIDANPIELKIMRYTREEYLGKHLSEIIHPEYQVITKKEFENLLMGGVVKVYETALVTKDGKKVDVEVSAVPQIERNETVGLHAISRDITERKKMEEELKKHHDHLEDKVRERTAELQTMVNVMADREIRMIELKKVIEKLRTQLKEAGTTPVANDPLKEIGKDYT